MPFPRFAVLASGLATLGAHASAQTAPASAASFKEACTEGKLSANARVRHETVHQDGFEDADSLTARLRLGFTTKTYHGFQAMLEGETVSQLTGDSFDGTGTNTTPPTATIADPENYEINQAWLAYQHADTRATLGRQRIVLDNARFIGDVGWRQNQQTFDAVLLQDKSLQKTTLTYGYLSRVNRVFDDRAPQYDWQSDSHIANASYSGLPFGTLTGYAYLLDFSETQDGARNASSQTYGLSFAGSARLTDTLSLLYRAEHATQTDYGASTLDYRSNYYLLEVGPKYSDYSLLFGYEVLGSDHRLAGSGFKTPLATLHAHNGWADKFLVTPDEGLADFYVKASAKLPADLSFLGMYHRFLTDDLAADYGAELDLQLSYQFDPRLSFTAKAAFYIADSVTGWMRTDTEKFWLQADYAY